MITSPIAVIRQFLQADGAVILPEIELVLFALGILLLDFWMSEKEKYWNAVLALTGTAFSGLTLWILRGQIAARGDLPAFHETVLIDPFFLVFGAIFLLATALVTVLSVKYLDIEDEQHGEYYALLLFACVGMMFMVSGIDLMVEFLGLETMALSFHVLTGFLRRSKYSNKAALKYVLLGGFSSGILAYGFSLLYGLSGTTSIGGIAAALAQRNNLIRAVVLSHEPGPAGEQIRQMLQTRMPAALHFDPWMLQALPMLAFVLIAIGLFFKVAAVPFHQWSPDVYEGAPTPISLYVSAASKTAAFAVLLRLFVIVFGPSQETWIYLVVGVALASLTWGNFAALRQTNLKRLLAYSSIVHIGYMLLGFVAWNQAGFLGIAYHLFAYVFMTVGAFTVVIVLRQKELIGDRLTDLDGLYQRSPTAAVLLLIFMLSLAGIPPSAGFLGKYYIFRALMESKHPVLAVLAVLSILPGLYYYTRLVVHAWKKPASDTLPLVMSSAEAVAMGVAVFVTLAAGLYPEPFTRLVRYAFGQ
ncbi:MAG TPA: NADH-quinone oxidoreductase subunit N [Candidatus Dormibacteraeota bacterium]|nr:NADH-quinone oxidoreductase subunit N [Candidatus Dormibacteraeota bacterium]